MKKAIILAVVAGFAAVMTASADGAKDNWDNMCAKCHGADGKGQTNIGKRLGCRDYSDAKVQSSMTDDAAFKAIKEGLKNSDGKVQMKPYTTLSDDDIKALVAFMRTFKQ
ncbi:MAG TPA: cytochrome c [Verrucomicrobiae bacterium]|nr:cytochrome c [Verrucomicrobiae bacterium]